MPSQKCVLTQTIGLTEVSITYFRPKVNEREVWGKLVPIHASDKLEQGQIPWRAGANENTEISFSTDVMIEGKLLEAGTYGFHVNSNQGKVDRRFLQQSQLLGKFFLQSQRRCPPRKRYSHRDTSP